MLGLDVDKFDREISSLWLNWDTNCDGVVMFYELFQQTFVLLA